MNSIKLFEDKQVRSTWSEAEEKWYFVVEDVVAILTDSKDPKQYIKRLRQRDEELSKGWVQFVPTLIIETAGGKQRMNCADLKGLFRIIQSIPSPKAEPFNDLELIFSMLGEASTTAIVRTQNPRGFVQNKQVARQGGKIAGDARKALELKTEEGVVSKNNFLPEKKKLKK